MRIAVLGGTGFIGRHVTRQLADAGAEVTTIERGTTAGAVGGVRALKADRSDPPVLARALSTAAPQVVVDMIAYRGEDVERLLESLPPSVERMVTISSGDVYATYGMFLGLEPEPGDTRPCDEQAPLRTNLFPYREHARGPDDLLHSYEKILVERAASAWAGGRVTILRLPMVYGPHDRQRRVAGYVERFRASAGSIRINPAEAGWRCTRGYVEDVAAAITLAAMNEAAAGITFNCGEQDALSEVAWAREIARAIDWQGEIVVDPGAPPSHQANWNVDLTVDTTRIRQMLGYQEPVGHADGLRRTAAIAPTNC